MALVASLGFGPLPQHFCRDLCIGKQLARIWFALRGSLCMLHCRRIPQTEQAQELMSNQSSGLPPSESSVTELATAAHSELLHKSAAT